MADRTEPTRKQPWIRGSSLALIAGLAAVCIQHESLLTGCAPEHAAAQANCACDLQVTCDPSCACDADCPDGGTTNAECNASNLYRFCKCTCDTHEEFCDSTQDENGGGLCLCDPACGDKAIHTGRVAARGVVLRNENHKLDPNGQPTWMEYDLLGQHKKLGKSAYGDGNVEATTSPNIEVLSRADYNAAIQPLVSALEADANARILARDDYAGLGRCTDASGHLVSASVGHPLREKTNSAVVGAPGESCNIYVRAESPYAADSKSLGDDAPCVGTAPGPACRSVMVDTISGKIVYRTAFILGRETAYLAFDQNDLKANPDFPLQCLPNRELPSDNPAGPFLLDADLYNEFLKNRAEGLGLPKDFPKGLVNMDLLEAQAFNDCKPGDMTGTNGCKPGTDGCEQQSRVVSPIQGALVEMVDAEAFRVDRTNEAGFYALYYPTPAEWFEFDVHATIAFSAFNPRIPSSKYYYLTQVGSRSAFRDPLVDGENYLLAPTTSVELLGTHAFNDPKQISVAGSTPETQSNFPVDAAMLVVNAYVTNAGVLPMAPDTDSDPDKKFHLVDVPHGAAGLEIDYDIEQQPNADQIPQLGLLKSFSEPDLRDTEIYVYRVADGLLIGSRWGLSDRELINNNVDVNNNGSFDDLGDREIPDCVNKACLQAVALFRGGAASFTGAAEQRYNAAVRVAPQLESDNKTVRVPGRVGIELDYGKNVNGQFRPQLRAGDTVKIIMISRSTGYMGTTLANYEPSSSGVGSFKPASGGICSDKFPQKQTAIPCILMRPPNLKVRVKRVVDFPYGATKGEHPDETKHEAPYIIGFEGSGLVTDKQITVETEWLDYDGTPLPEELPGFTGRIAKVELVSETADGGTSGDGGPDDLVQVTGPNDASQTVHLVGDHSGLVPGDAGDDGGVISIEGPASQGGESLTGLFPIGPGKRTSVIKLPEKQVDLAHFYIHIDAQPIERNIDFSGRPKPAKPSFSLHDVCFSGCVDIHGEPVVDCDNRGVDVTQTQWTCVRRKPPESYKSDAGYAFTQRPASYVPFLVPRYNATATTLAQPRPGQSKADPVYDWGYRPEMQFSLFDLTATALEIKEGVDDDPRDVLKERSTLPRDTTRVDLRYALAETEVGSLQRFGDARELVFALGPASTEVKAQIGENQTADFTSVNVNKALSTNDLIALRLYQKNDAGNVLWEYGFVGMKLYLTRGEEKVNTIKLDKDEPTTVHAVLQPEDKDELAGIQWKIVDQDKGVKTTIENRRGALNVIHVEEDSEPGWITVEALTPKKTKTHVRFEVGCDCKDCQAAGACSFAVDSVSMTFSLGTAEGGLSAGNLILKRDTLDADAAKRSALELSVRDDGVMALSDDKGLRQVVAPGTFVEIEDLSAPAVGYELRFYERSVGKLDAPDPATGLFPVVRPDAQNHAIGAYAIWKVEDLGAQGNGSRKLRVTETRDNGSTTHIHDYEHDAAGAWILTEGAGLRVERRSEQHPTPTTRVTHVTISGPTGVSSELEQKYEFKAWGEAQIEETRGTGSTTQTAHIAYYEDANDPGSYSKVRSRTEQDGSWVSYAYDTQGRLVTEMHPWLDSPSRPEDATPTLGHVTRYDFDPVDSLDIQSISPDANAELFNSPRKVTEWINGIQVGLTYHSIRRTSDGGRVEIEERCAKQNAPFGSSDCLHTETTFTAPDPNTTLGGRVLTVKSPDGPLRTYAYERGTWTGNAFSPGDGQAIRQTVTAGTTQHPTGIAYKTTRQVSVTDAQGNVVLEQQYAYTPSGYELIGWTRFQYDSNGHLVRTDHSNGEIETATWGCCEQNETIDSQGIATTVLSRDGLNRVLQSLRSGIVTAYEYDPEGRVLEIARSGGALSLTSVRSYDALGRVESTTSEDGLLTTQQYELDGLRTVTVRPGGFTEISETHHDGQPKSTAGSAVVAEYFTHTVNGDGTRTIETRRGSPTSPVFERTVTDMLSRTVSVERPGYSGSVEVARTFYNSKGQVERTTDSGVADTLYVYNELGEQFRTGIDINGNQSLDLASTDRISESDAHFVQVGDDWWNENEQRMYTDPLVATPRTTGSSRARLTGLGAGGLFVDQVSVDISGNETHSTVLVDRASHTETRLTAAPDSIVTGSSVSVDGRVQSLTSTTGLTTQYRYDALGRRTQEIDPRTGSSVTTYDPSTGRVTAVTDAAGNSNTFGYDANTGRKTRECNALGKCSYFEYTARGELSRTWGDVPYPVEYVYDELGRRTEMHTFRADLGWTTAVWPTGASIAADVTTWDYEPSTGLLLAKHDAANKSATYTYDVAGRLKTRTWSRPRPGGGPLTTTYGYDPATGDLATVDYNDTTPDVTYSYDRVGRQSTVTDGTGSRTFAYDPSNLQLTSETMTGVAPAVLSRRYATTGMVGRPSGMALGSVYDVSYGYDTVGRFQALNWTIDGSQDTASYSRVPQSELIAGYTTVSGLSVAYAYETARDLRTQVRNQHGSTVTSQYDYENDALGRRENVMTEGTAFAASAFSEWAYDDRNQILTSHRFLGNNLQNTSSPVPSENQAYDYDAIGNRTSATAHGTTASYQANNLNQYESIGATVPVYDADGDLIDDGTKTMTYNAENQLVRAEVPGVSVSTFEYDYAGREIRKNVDVMDGSGPDYSVAWVYSGWSKLEERKTVAGVATKKSYVWGLDLSQSRQGAGGVAGLLAVVANASSSWFTYDANGNVSELVSSAGAVRAHYEYDVYGNVLTTTGDEAAGNAWRFSTKYVDEETDLLYYGMRFYDSKLGMWTTRDPSGELGGLNLHQFARNAPTYRFDAFGLEVSGGEGQEVGEALRQLAENNGVNFQDLKRVLQQMWGSWDVFLRLGNQVHQFVYDKYSLFRENRGVFDTYVPGILQKVGMSPRSGYSSLARPDIFDLLSHEVYEVKSRRGLALGIVEVADYVSELHDAGLCFASPGLDGGEATNNTYRGESGLTVDWRWATPGVIIYEFTRLPEEVPVPVPAKKKVENENTSKYQINLEPSPEAVRTGIMTTLVAALLALIVVLGSLAGG